MIPPSEQAALRTLIEDYVSLSKGMRFEDKRGYWDTDEPWPVLSPEEAERHLVGWDAIEGYWSMTRSTLSDLQSRCWGVLIQPISPTVALVLFHLEWTADVVGLSHGTPLGAHVRVTAALRHKAVGWRIFSYVEGHVDAVEYMRAFYRSQALSGGAVTTLSE